MKKVTDYFTIMDFTPEKIDMQVKNHIRDGWQPLGSPYVVNSGVTIENKDETYICQPMVMYS